MLLKSLKDVIVLCVLVNMPVKFAYTFQTSPWNLMKRAADQGEDSPEGESPFITCEGFQYRSTEGNFTFFSGGAKRYCSLFLAAPIDHNIVLEFNFFHVDCDDGGAVGLLDGWELDHQIFPSADDHPHPMSLRYLLFCGANRPGIVYISKQNVAQLQFVIPRAGQGFTVNVKFTPNSKPCNMLLLSQFYDKITLRNFGLARNCTVLSLYPQRIQFLSVNVGTRRKVPTVLDKVAEMTEGLRTFCGMGETEDSVQLYRGRGVGAQGRRLVLGFCGVRSRGSPNAVRLNCHSSSLRLQSTGEFFNTVKFAVLPEHESMC